MGLSRLDLGGLGRFRTTPRAAFTIQTLNLPTSWEYIYQNRKLLLKVDQFGPLYAQADPPSDIILFRREPFQRWSSWLVWLRSDAFACTAFPNYFRPGPHTANPSAQPDAVEITFSPTAATYTLEYEGVRCVTELFVPTDQCAVCLKLTVTNLRDGPINLSLIPALRPYANPAMLAPWDKPEWYLKTYLCRERRVGFVTRLLNMNSEPAKRRTVVLWSDTDGLSATEISYGHFVGQGNFDKPQAVFDGTLRLSPSDARGWNALNEAPVICGFPPVCALQYNLELAPGETRSIRQALAMLRPRPDGALPAADEASEVSALLDEATRRKEHIALEAKYETLATARTVETPDAALNDYVNDWLPLQLDWACSLDRGWPSGMRGSRDSANDFTAMVPINPGWGRQILETLFSCQRSDGWFPRQYSAQGRAGRHDMRGHVDAGCWVIELLHHYLCFTKDFAFANVPLAWLDLDEEATMLDHALKAIEFFICQENVGEHGLCKIGEGDWLDSVNRAGLKGRGESVMVTNQAIIAMVEMALVVEKLKALGLMDPAQADATMELYERRRRELAEALRTHAFNDAGYFNGVFNDDGKWLFSNKDPDGERRVYGPANWFSISSGVAGADLTESVLKELEYLRCDDGYRLYHPPLGRVPIERVGRGGSGDQPAGLWENGNAYNQGSHGFLGRALTVAGRGDLLYDVIRYLLPYDQDRHPVPRVKTPPYAVVNCWQNVPGFERHGGFQFLTGSTAYGLRMVYEWMFGIKPMPDGLVVDPCVPSAFNRQTARFTYLGKRVELEIVNPDARQCGVTSLTVNGKPVKRTVVCPFSGRTLFVADDELFAETANTIEVRL